MQISNNKRPFALWAGVFAALVAAPIMAAPAGAVAANLKVLHPFAGGSDGVNPVAGLISDREGNLYGTTVGGGGTGCGGAGCGTVFKILPDGNENVLYSFSGSDGASPEASLIADEAGNLYGTTREGGTTGLGTVFELLRPGTPGGAWTEIVLRSFAGEFGGGDGAWPEGSLIRANNGNLYGTTPNGGTGCPSDQGPGGCGTVFKLAPPSVRGGTWKQTVLYAFKGGSDGGAPGNDLLADGSGNLYGTTGFGGTGCGGAGCGTVFVLSPAGTKTVLYAFAGGNDGANPFPGLTADSSGNLYGTTLQGGKAGCAAYGGTCGTVFRLAPPSVRGGTWKETVLYRFGGGADGGSPFATLIVDSRGHLYGTTVGSGNTGPRCGGTTGCGVVFRLSPPAAPGANWTETVLHSFTGGSDGSFPEAGLIADPSGNLYGTSGGAGDCVALGLSCGAVFKLTNSGFAPFVPFSAFEAALDINFGKTPNTDSFELLSELTLGQNSKGINPSTEPVTLTVGAFATTIRAGSFLPGPNGIFYFIGAVNGVNLQAAFLPTGAKRYRFAVAAQNANLAGTVNPLTVTLTIGANSGTASVTANIDRQVVSAAKGLSANYCYDWVCFGRIV